MNGLQKIIRQVSKLANHSQQYLKPQIYFLKLTGASLRAFDQQVCKFARPN